MILPRYVGFWPRSSLLALAFSGARPLRYPRICVLQSPFWLSDQVWITMHECRRSEERPHLSPRQALAARHGPAMKLARRSRSNPHNTQHNNNTQRRPLQHQHHTPNHPNQQHVLLHHQQGAADGRGARPRRCTSTATLCVAASTATLCVAC